MNPPPRSPDANPPEEKSALDWAAAHGAAGAVMAEVDRQLRRRRRRRSTLAGATVAALLIAGIAWQNRLKTPAAPVAMPVNVVVSLPAKRILPDGSTVELKDGAQITFDYSGPLRRVTLQKGEAHFAVAKNKERPFVVEASGVEVRAVGTAFSVQFDARKVEVLVTEGRVAVTSEHAPTTGDRAPSSDAPTEATLVDAGHSCVVALSASDTTAPAVASLTPREQDERLAWRIPRLEFSGTPLSQAIPMFNEHARVKLTLADPALEGLELSGVLRADNTDSLLRLLENEFHIKAEPRGEEIILRRGP